jgi:methionine sulfoxide reductase heme-binding subunit
VNATSWYVARSAGTVAYLLLSSSVVIGLLLAGRTSFTWPRFAVEEVHRFLAILTGVFLLLHGGGLLVDRVVPFGLVQVLVPFTSTYRPFGVALGVVAAELLAAVAVSNALRARLPYRAWRRVHYLTIAVWFLATVHLVLVGTDRGETWFAGLAGASVGAVSLALAARLGRRVVEAPGGSAAVRRSGA